MRKHPDMNTTLVRAGFLMACALPVSAEAPPPPLSPVPPAPAADPKAPKEGEPSPVDRHLERYRERLALAPEQVDKVRAILAEAARREEASRKETEDRIRELLTEAQRPRLDEMQKAPEAGGPRGAPAPGRWMGPSIDDLQRELALTSEQREKAAALIQAAADAARKRFEEARAGGLQNLDWGAIRAEAEKLYSETTERIRDLLTPEQQPKFAKLVEERSRILHHVFRRPETPAERVAHAMEALKIASADEAAAVKSLVTRTAQLQGELADLDRAARDQARDLLKAEGTTDAALAERMAARRRERQALEDRLRKSQEELGQVVTVRQEMELVQLGLLR
jgi:Spy/CpxP family protein refolding chaperone